jgi:hypothetical protein
LVVVGNFWAYQSAAGWGWTALRLAWGVIALVWLMINLFYWPFWLVQHDRRPHIALRNALLFLMRSPALALTVAAICAALAIGSVLVTLPLAAGLMVWLALLSTLAVDVELHTSAPDLTAPVETPRQAQVHRAGVSTRVEPTPPTRPSCP